MIRTARSCAGLISRHVSLPAHEEAGWAAASAALHHQQQDGFLSVPSLQSSCQAPVWCPLNPASAWGTYPSASCHHHQLQGFGSVRHMSLWSRVTNWRKPSVPSSSSQGSEFSPDSTLQAALPEPQPPPDWPLPEQSSEAFQAIVQATAAGDHAVYAMAKHDAWFSSAWVMDGLNYLHTSCGMSWWSSIAGLYLVSRVATFPLTIYGQKVSARISEVNDRVARMNMLARQGQTASNPQEAFRIQQTVKSEMSSMQAEHGSLPSLMGKQIGTLFGNMVVFLSIFNGVRTLLGTEMQSLRMGGTLWFPDLTMPDPYYGLPVLCALTTAAMLYRNLNTEGGNLTADPNMQKYQKPLTYFAYLMSFMFIPAGGYLPAGVAVLWTTGACWGIAQGLLIRIPEFRQAVGLPSTEELAERKKRQAANQAAATPNAETAGVYDPAKAAQELMHKVEKNNEGKPMLYTHNPAAAAAAAGSLWQAQHRLGGKGHKARRR